MHIRRHNGCVPTEFDKLFRDRLRIHIPWWVMFARDGSLLCRLPVGDFVEAKKSEESKLGDQPTHSLGSRIELIYI
jgi:hypothetical protein